MATVEDMIKQYETDPEIKKEVDEILAKDKVTIADFKAFAKKHDVDVSLLDIPKYMAEAKKLGLIK